MRKFIYIISVITCIVIVYSVIYKHNMTIEQKIGINQIFVQEFKKKDVSDLEKYAMQEGFEYEEDYQKDSALEKSYGEENSMCESKRSIIYNGDPHKIMYECWNMEKSYKFVYDFENNSWYPSENRSDEEKDFIDVDFERIKLPSEEQEIFNQEFKEIHEEIKKGVEKFKEK